MNRANVKERIIELWRNVPRNGVEDLIMFLEGSDFFDAPCSTQYHLATPGGLAEHSFNVYNTLAVKVGCFSNPPPHESIAVCALGHDLCKVNYYATEKKWRKDARNQWEQYDAYVVKDQFPMGHGEKSVSILQDFIKLEDYEKLAIRWHMSAFDLTETYGKYAYNEAVKLHPLVTLLHTADLEASNIIEAGQ